LKDCAKTEVVSGGMSLPHIVLTFFLSVEFRHWSVKRTLSLVCRIVSGTQFYIFRMAESITPELELSLLQLMLRCRSLGSPDGFRVCEQLRARVRRALITAESSDDAVVECSKLQRRFARKVAELDGSLDVAREKKRARKESRRHGASAFVDTEAGEGEDDDDDTAADAPETEEA
jgi:hypothetical protein